MGGLHHQHKTLALHVCIAIRWVTPLPMAARRWVGMFLKYLPAAAKYALTSHYLRRQYQNLPTFSYMIESLIELLITGLIRG
eukprot:scaffold5207_cov61-Attheya_sp.AAC.2